MLEKFAKLSSMENLRAETTQIFDQIPNLLIQSLNAPLYELTNSLNQISS